jgi:hypothetical protein
MTTAQRPARMLFLALSVLTLLFGIAGCGTTPGSAINVSKAASKPCPTAMPPRPAFATESLKGDESFWEIWSAYKAERPQRKAYEIELATRLQGCVEK